MGEREVEVGDVFPLDDAGLVDHVEHRAVVAVGDHAALRRAGRARGVDEGADVGLGHGAPAPLPGGGVAAAAGRRGPRARSRRRWSRSSGSPARASAAGRGPGGSSPAARRPRRPRPWRRSSRARTGTPRASSSGRSGRRRRRSRARRSRSRSTRAGCCRGSRPCRPSRRRGRRGRERAGGPSPRSRGSCGETHSSPSLKRIAGHLAVHLRRTRQQVREGGGIGSPLLHHGESSSSAEMRSLGGGGAAVPCSARSPARASARSRRAILSILPWNIGTPISTHLPITSCRFMCISSASSDGVR